MALGAAALARLLPLLVGLAAATQPRTRSGLALAAGSWPADSDSAEPTGGSQDKMFGNLLNSVWGSAQWPRSGEASRPPRAGSSGMQDEGLSRWLELAFVLAAGAACSGLIFTFRRAPVAPKPPAGGARAPVAPPAAAPTTSLFGTHFRALAHAIVWRNLHTKALIMQLVRLAVPVLFLSLLHYARGWLTRQFADPRLATIMEGFGNITPAEAVDSILEYSLSVTMLYVAMMSMVFFVGHLASESESGFRRLLHISGLSRPAYLAATAGVDGLLHGLLSLCIMVVVAAATMQIRLVLWTSPALILLLLLQLQLTAVLIGYLLHFACWSSSMASTISQVLVMIVTFSAPFSPLGPTVPAAEDGGRSWKALALPAIPGYGGVFELVRACVKGRCLTLGDVEGAYRRGETATVWSMIFGIEAPLSLTPPAALLSLNGLVMFQLLCGWLLVVLLDLRRHPALHQVASKGPGAAQAAGAVLEVRGLQHRYGWLKGAVGGQDRVLNGVSFSVAPGSMLGLLGPNGAGKTTTIRCITGEEAASEGTVSISPPANGGGGAYIGLCPQETILNEDLTTDENLLFFANVRGEHGYRAELAVQQILAATRLEEKRGWLPAALSGGMRRRLAVACAMVGRPSVAILDEPTTGLDPVSRRGIWGAVGEIKATGGCCLLTTHMLEEAEALCGRLVILRRGRVAAEGSVQQLKEQWGMGYVLSIDCTPGEEETARNCVASMLPADCHEPVKTATHSQMVFKVTCDAERVGHLFIGLAKVAESNGIRHWGISQASLEDAYLRIIQEDERGVRECAVE